MNGKRHIEPGFSERVRELGGSDDLVEFTRRHEARFSQADIDRTWGTAFGLGAALTLIVVAIVLVWPR